MRSRVVHGGWIGVLLVVLGSAACQSASGGPASPTESATTGAQASSTGFTNPVYATNFADPMIIDGGDGRYRAFATNGNGSNVQVLSSADLVDWQVEDDALPALPAWSSAGKVWAPEVAVHDQDRFVLYYTTRAPNPEIQCIGVAVASKPGGPYVDRSSGPIVCEKDQGGSIDAHPFRASDGKRYLYWKNDGNAVGQDTWISVAERSSDGTKLAGPPKKLIKQDLGWEGPLVEAPFVWEHDGAFHLFYSANSFASADYAVGHAVGSSPTGPFRKDEEPVLTSNDVAAGPGHCALFAKDGKTWMVFHAWAPDSIDVDPPGRTMWLTEVAFGADGAVTVTPPTASYPTRP